MIKKDVSGGDRLSREMGLCNMGGMGWGARMEGGVTPPGEGEKGERVSLTGGVYTSRCPHGGRRGGGGKYSRGKNRQTEPPTEGWWGP